MYDELIKALKCKGLHFEDCQECGCPYYDTNGYCDYLRIESDAADVIEELQRKEKFHAFIWNTLGHEQMRQLVELYHEQETSDAKT